MFLKQVWLPVSCIADSHQVQIRQAKGINIYFGRINGITRVSNKGRLFHRDISTTATGSKDVFDEEQHTRMSKHMVIEDVIANLYIGSDGGSQSA